jgi:hypothetical protein
MADVERNAALGFDPLRTRLVFVHQLPPRARAAFRDAVDEALDRQPPRSPEDDPYLQRLHRIWTDARRQAFEATIAGIDDDSRR